MADLENGVWAGNQTPVTSSNTPIVADYVTAMVKGKAGGLGLKGGDANSGALKVMYEGGRPKGYEVMVKQGAIILGIGGAFTMPPPTVALTSKWPNSEANPPPPEPLRIWVRTF